MLLPCEQRASEVHCYATPIYNIEKCSLTDEFFRAFATLIFMKFKFLGSHGVVLVKTFPLMYQLLM